MTAKKEEKFLRRSCVRYSGMSLNCCVMAELPQALMIMVKKMSEKMVRIMIVLFCDE